MGVYIKGVAMPENCKRCEFETDELLCDLTGGHTDGVRNSGRLEGCPLVEIKMPHGDLIDKEVVKQDLSDFYNGIVTARRLIDAQDVVIEAEGGD